MKSGVANNKWFQVQLCKTHPMLLWNNSGGGAYKFESDFRDLLEMELLKFDELKSLIDGVHYIHYINPSNECFYYKDPFDDRGCFSKENYDFSNPYPYLVVNIGSGVSIIAGLY